MTEPLIALLVKGTTLVDVAPVFDDKSLAQLEALAEKEQGVLIKIAASRIINPATGSPLVLAAKEAVNLFSENHGRLKEATGNSIRFQIVEEAMVKLKAALP